MRRSLALATAPFLLAALCLGTGPAPATGPPTTPDELRRLLPDGVEAGADTCTRAAPRLIRTTPHFRISYTAILGGLAIADYATALETAWATEVDELGWAAPIVAGPGTVDGRYVVHVEEMRSTLYGYTIPLAVVGDNPATPWTEHHAASTCIVLNRDMSTFGGTAVAALRGVAAHELNHAIQLGYGVYGSRFPDGAFFEGGATWMEDQVFDDADDSYLDLWPTMEEGLGDYDGRPYNSWLLFQGLTERFGDADEQVLQDHWEEISRERRFGLDALAHALSLQGVDLPTAFHDAAVAIAFSRSCGGAYVLPLCFAEGDAYRAAAGPSPRTGVLAAGADRDSVIEDAFATHLLDVHAGVSSVRVENTSDGVLRASLACDTGAAIDFRPLGVLLAGASAEVEVATGCAGTVLVVTNETVRSDDPDTSTSSAYRVAPTG